MRLGWCLGRWVGRAHSAQNPAITACLGGGLAEAAPVAAHHVEALHLLLDVVGPVPLPRQAAPRNAPRNAKQMSGDKRKRRTALTATSNEQMRG